MPQSEEAGEPSASFGDVPAVFIFEIQKCDAKQPCTTCLRLDGGSECVYEQSRIIQRKGERMPADAQAFLFSFKSKPSPCESPSPWVGGEDSSLFTLNPASPETSSSSSSTHQPSSPVSPEESHYSGCDVPDELKTPTPQRSSSPETQLVPFRVDPSKPYHADKPPAFSSSFFRPSSIPRPPHLSIGLLYPERFQISGTTSSESDLSLCVFPFSCLVSS